MLASARLGPNPRQPVVTLDDSFANKAGSPESAVWMTYGVTKGMALVAARTAPRSSFSIELEAWRRAMSVAAEMDQKGNPLSDPALAAMLKLDRAGELAPALLILTYRESYRPDWESWKQAHPTGLAAFIDTYGLRP